MCSCMCGLHKLLCADYSKRFKTSANAQTKTEGELPRKGTCSFCIKKNNGAMPMSGICYLAFGILSGCLWVLPKSRFLQAIERKMSSIFSYWTQFLLSLWKLIVIRSDSHVSFPGFTRHRRFRQVIATGRHELFQCSTFVGPAISGQDRVPAGCFRGLALSPIKIPCNRTTNG